MSEKDSAAGVALEEPIKIRWTGKARERLTGWAQDLEDREHASAALTRQKTNVVIETVPEATEVVKMCMSVIGESGRGGRTWVNGAIDSAGQRVKSEIRAEMDSRGYELINPGSFSCTFERAEPELATDGGESAEELADYTRKQAGAFGEMDFGGRARVLPGSGDPDRPEGAVAAAVPIEGEPEPDRVAWERAGFGTLERERGPGFWILELAERLKSPYVEIDGGEESEPAPECPNGCGQLEGSGGNRVILECPECGYEREARSFAPEERALREGGLSEREAEVIARTLEGWTRSEIADSLGIAASTVDNKRQRSKAKRAEALALLEAWDPDGAAAELAESASRRD